MKKIALILTVALVSVGCRTQSSPPVSSEAPQNRPAEPRREVPRNRPALSSYADIVDRAMPAVVTIRSARRARPAQQFPFSMDPLLEQFFGRRGAPRQQPQQQQLGLGSGVVVSADGTVLTNHHVIDGAEEITVEMGDRRTMRAKLVGSDPPSDIAVLKLEGRDLPVLHLANSDNVRIGDVALAIGNPLGIGQTVTSGIISAKGRATGLSDGSFEDFLQTDAAINRGNSGGALIDSNGDLIGINSQILSPTGAYIGIGFAIPSNMAKNVMDQLLQTGKVRRGQIGIMGGTVTADIAQKLNLKERRGVFVADVVPGGPAARAGIRPNDVILALNGERVEEMNQFRIRVSSTPPGSGATLRILRDGREQDVKLQLGELQPSARRQSDEER